MSKKEVIYVIDEMERKFDILNIILKKEDLDIVCAYAEAMKLSLLSLPVIKMEKEENYDECKKQMLVVINEFFDICDRLIVIGEKNG